MRNARDDESPDLSEARRADAEDVARALAGDLAAYGALIERYQRRAVAVSYRLLGKIEDAQDVCQEAFLKAYRSLGTLENTERFGAWMMRIVSNLSLNYRRGRKPQLSLTNDDDSRSVAEDVDERRGRRTTNPGELLASEEMGDAITKAIEALPETQRLALIMFAIEGIPQKEVAEIMECSVEMVKWNVFQARKSLKEALAEHLVE